MGQSQMEIKIRRIMGSYSAFKSRRDKIFVESHAAYVNKSRRDEILLRFNAGRQEFRMQEFWIFCVNQRFPLAGARL